MTSLARRSCPIVAAFLLALCALASGVRTPAAEPLPRFFRAEFGDVRDKLATEPRKFKPDDPAWQPKLVKPRGEAAGETTVTLRFPVAAEAVPVRFGMPLGRVPTAENVVVLDEQGRAIDADVFPLVNFETSPLNWVLIATVLDAPADGERKLTVKWGPDVKRPAPTAALTITGNGDGSVRLSGGAVEFTLSPKTLIEKIQRRGGKYGFAPGGCRMSLDVEGQTIAHDPAGRIVELYDGPRYKWYRIETQAGVPGYEALKLHLEVETHVGSPVLKIRARIVNTGGQAYQNAVANLRLLEVAGSGDGCAVSAAGERDAVLEAERQITVAQRVDDWSITADGKQVAAGEEDNLGEWVRTAIGDEALTLIVPDFQGYGPGDPDHESQLAAKSDGTLMLKHYAPHPAGGDGAITWWHTAARTFPMALHLGPAAECPAMVAEGLREPPSVVRDRRWLTAQGVFCEPRVTQVYDEPSLEGARYFARTRSARHDYPRMGRGMPPQKGEGFEHPYTDTGGMLFGEVWQYTKPPGTLDLSRQYVPGGNLPTWYKPKTTNSITTYRCGDHALAMAHSYLRTGDRMVYDIFQDHPLLFCDWAISHQTGGTHYYCSFNAHVHVYSRLAGPLSCYLVEGDPWLFETAERMAGFLCNAWRDDHPTDVQTRSVYPARGLSQLYEVTGQRAYWNEAVDRTIWYLDTGVRDDGVVRGHANTDARRTPLFAGYCLLGVIPVVERCGNARAMESVRHTGDWLLRYQGKQDEDVNAGLWVRDTWIWSRPNLGPGNCGSATLCAEILTWLAQVTREQRYFYGAAAAWSGQVTTTRHEGVRGGLPMQSGSATSIGTWSDKFPVYLHRLPAVAEELGLPFVVEGVYAPKRSMPVVVFAAAGGRFEEDRLRQPLFVRNDEPAAIPIWCPRPPREATFSGHKIELDYDPATNIARVTLPADSDPGELVVRF